MSVEADLERALLDKLTEFATLQSLPVAWENKTFTVPDDQHYLEPKHFPAQNGNLAWGAGTELSGFLSVGVCFKAGGGTPPARDLAGELVEHFAKGTRMDRGDVVVRIQEKPSVGSAVQDGQKVIIPVTIRYRCFVS